MSVESSEKQTPIQNEMYMSYFGEMPLKNKEGQGRNTPPEPLDCDAGLMSVKRQKKGGLGGKNFTVAALRKPQPSWWESPSQGCPLKESHIQQRRPCSGTLAVLGPWLWAAWEGIRRCSCCQSAVFSQHSLSKERWAAHLHGHHNTKHMHRHFWKRVRPHFERNVWQ